MEADLAQRSCVPRLSGAFGTGRCQIPAGCRVCSTSIHKLSAPRRTMPSLNRGSAARLTDGKRSSKPLKADARLQHRQRRAEAVVAEAVVNVAPA